MSELTSGWHKRRMAEYALERLRESERRRQIAFAMATLAFVAAIVLAGCATTPADKAFVGVAGDYYRRTRPFVLAGIAVDAHRHPVEKRLLVGLVEDHALAVEANEERVGIAAVASGR